MSALIEGVSVTVDGDRVVIETTSSHGRTSVLKFGPSLAKQLAGAVADAADNAAGNHLRSAA